MDCTATYGLQNAAPKRRASWWIHLRIVLLSLVGGALGIAGAFVSEVRAGGFLLLPFLGAPIIEEAFKPVGVFLALAKWPWALTNRLYVACLCALGGLVFGVIECLVYLYLYVPDHSSEFALYRWTLPLVLHTTASFIVGFGLSRGVVDWVNGRGRLTDRTIWFYVAGVALHAVYNTTAVTLELTDVVNFE